MHDLTRSPRDVADLATSRLLAAGEPGHHPASAVVGVCAGDHRATAAVGWAELPMADAPGEPVTADMLLDFASVTKVAVTTTLAMMLVEGGQLRLEERVQRYVADFRDGAKADVTVEQLLTHTGGLQPWWPLYLQTRDRSGALGLAAALPLAASPGSAWIYSDLGMMLMGRIIEEIMGSRLDDAFAAMVASRLGISARFGPVDHRLAATSADGDTYEYRMVDTGQPYPVPFEAGDFAYWRDRPLRGEVNDGNAAHALDGVSGHAGLFATADDLLVLAGALQGGDLVGRHVLERFAEPSALNSEQAVGFRTTTLQQDGAPVRMLMHGGFTGTFLAFGVDQPVAVAGGAMRLYGTLGPIAGVDDTGASAHPAETGPAVAHLVQATTIRSIMLDAAQELLPEDRGAQRA